LDLRVESQSPALSADWHDPLPAAERVLPIAS